jgi:DNA polymerase III subunit epsilon
VNLLRRLTGRPDAAATRAVPGRTDLDRPWRDAEYVVLDLETTGLDLRRDEIVSYGAVVVRAGRAVVADAEYGLVRPERDVPAAAVRVHALRADDLAGAPPLAEVVPRLVDLLAGRVLVAHAAWVERAFLGRALPLAGARLEGPVLCTAALAREALLVRGGDEGGEPRLEALANRLDVPVHTPHHALGDALTTANVFLALVGRLEAGGPATVRSLTAISRRRSLR